MPSCATSVAWVHNQPPGTLPPTKPAASFSQSTDHVGVSAPERLTWPHFPLLHASAVHWLPSVQSPSNLQQFAVVWWTHTLPAQVSVVQVLPSSHVAWSLQQPAMASCVQVPPGATHLSSVHTSLSSHFTASAACRQPVEASQLSMVQPFLSSQSLAPPPLQ